MTTASFYTTSPFSSAGWSITSTLTTGTTVPIDSSTGNPYVWFVFPGQTRPLLIAQWSTNVSTPEQLQLTGAVLGATYTQINDIDLSSSFTSASTTWNPSMGFIPIGYTTPFQGNYNGKNYTINGLVIIDNSANPVGLFGTTIGSASLTNIGVTNANVTKAGSAGAAGILLGSQNSTTASVFNSYSTGMITSSLGNLGGLIGQTANGANANAINFSYSTATVKELSTVNGNVGGLVGYLGQQETLQNSYATGAVSGSAVIGGLVGGANQGIIKTSYSGGSVTATSSSATRLGGLVGACLSCSITDSYSYASVTGVSGASLLGGLVGLASATAISNTYSSGLVTAGGATTVGGFIGSLTSGTVSNSFWDTVTSGQPTVGISSGSTTGLTGLTTSQFFTLSNFSGAGWSITNAPSSTAVKPATTWFMFTTNGNTRPMLMMEWQPNIVNAHQLQMVGTTLAASYTLANNLDLNSSMTNPSDVWATNANAPATSVGSGFVPIGYVGTNLAFIGTFDGNNNTISNLYVGVTSSTTPTNVDAGLFGNLNTPAVIKNVGLLNANITGGQFVGALVGYGATATISNSYVNGGYITAPNTGSASIGGLVGRLDLNSSLSTSFSNVIINVGSGSAGVGGLIGYLNTGSITNAYSLSPIFILPTGSAQVGGFVGLNTGTITNAYSTGTIRGAGISSLGGFVGSNGSAGIIQNAFWDIATSSLTAGFGTNTGTITNLTGSTFASSLSTQSTFTNVGWGFGGPINGSSPWTISAGAYPYFSVAATGYAELSGATPTGSTGTAIVAANGVLAPYTITHNIDGSYYISAPISAFSGKDILVWLPTASGTHATAVGFGAASGTGTVVTSGSINNLDLISNQITVGSSNALYATPISNTDLATAIGSLSTTTNPGIIYSASGNNLTLATSSYNIANFVTTSITPYTMTGNILSATGSTTSATFNNTLAISPSVAILTTLGGNITFNGAVTAASNFTVNSGGSIVQSASAKVTVPGTLTATAGSTIGLNTTSNAINAFGATASGAINLLNTASTLALNAITENTAAAVTINNTGNLVTNGAITFSSGTLGLTATTGTLTIGANVTGTSGNINLTSTGASSDILFSAGTVNSTGSVNINAGRDISLQPSSNAIIGLNTASGPSSVTLTPQRNIVTAAGTEISANPTTGTVTLTAHQNINSAGTIDPANVVLSAVGTISQTGVVDANVLTATSGTGGGAGDMTITNAANNFAAISATNQGASGAINILDNVSSLSIQGLSQSNASNTGAITLQNTGGSLVLNGNVTSHGGIINLVNGQASGNVFTNNVGSGAISGGVYRIWSYSPVSDVVGNLNAGYVQYNAIYGSATPALSGSNGLLYAIAPNINVTVSTTRTYNGSTLINLTSSNYTINSGILNNDVITTANLNASSTNTSSANVGTYSINPTIGYGNVLGVTGNPGATNSGIPVGIPVYGYNVNVTSGTATITPATLTYSANSATRTYGAANPAFSGTVTGFVNGETIASATSGTLAFTTPAIATSNVGSYAINGSGLTANNGNYVFVQDPANATALTITPATLTYSANSATRTYGAANPALSGTVTGFVNGESIASATSGTLAFTTPAIATSNVGSYAINGSGLTANNGNYVFAQAAGNSTALTITPATLTYTANTASKVYGTANPTFSGNVTGFVNGESQASATSGTLSFTSPALNNSNVGSYAINGGGLTANNGNYIFVQAAGNSTALTITPATLTYTANTATKVYGSANPAFSGTVTGFASGDTIANATSGTLSFTSPALNNSNVGSYAINGSGLAANNGNYIFAQAAGNSTALTITPATLTYTANTASKIYGTANPTFSGTVTGFASGDTIANATSGTLSFTSPALNNSNVGTYAINGGGLTANNGNYIFLQAAGNSTALTITPATLTYTANTATKVYGSANPAFSGTVTGFASGDTIANATSGTLSFTSPALNNSNVGSYAINGSGLAANNGNYIFAQAAGNSTALTITPATLTYTANTASKIYGSANPAFSGTISGFVLGQTQASATTGTLSFTSSATTSSNVGSYDITGGGLTANNGNYIFAQAAGNPTAFTINPATLTYTANAASRTYGAANPAFSGTVTGFVLGQNQATATTGTLAFTSPATAASNVGSYAINGSGLTANNGNYTFVQASGNSTALTITPASLTYVANSASRNYGDVNPSFSGTVTGFLNGDTQASATTGTLAFTSPATVTSDVGLYAINGSGLSATNYTFTQAAGNATALQVTPRPVTLSGVTAQDKVYDATTNASLQGTPSASNIVNGDVINVTGTGVGTFAQKDVGSNIPVYINGYTLSGTKASDYVITLNPDNAQITSSANITPATINATNITANSRVYDTTTNAGINTGTAGLSGVFSGDSVSLDTSTATGTFSDKNVGTNKLVTINNLGLTGSNANDYVLSTTTTTANITPYTLNVTGIVANDKTYDGTTTATLSNTGTLQSPLGSDTVNLNTTGYAANFANPNVGTNIPVTVTGYGLTGADAGNYILASPLTTTANITPATINIDLSANNFHIIYGPAYNFTGTEFTTTSGGNPISTTITGVTFTVAGMSGPNIIDARSVVGSYTVTPSNATGTDLSNYSINYINGTVTIDPRPVSIINVTAQTKTYDGTTNATINTGSAQLGNVYGSDVVTLGINTAQGTFDTKNVGTNKLVTITGSFTLSGADASNYVIANPPGTTVGDITPATLTVTADSGQTKVYGTANPASYTYTANGFVSGDNVGNSLTGALTRNAGENVGNYTINQGTLATVSGNYTISYTSDQFAITPASLTITANSGSKTYGDTYTALTGSEFTTSGLVAGDSVTSVSLASAGAVNTAPVNTPPVGHYAITASAALGSGLSNYNITYVNGDLAVNQRPLTVSGITTTGKVYDSTTNVNPGEVQFSGATITPLFSDNVTLNTSGITAQFVSPNAGANTININGLALTGPDAGNYSLLNPNVAIATPITPKTLSIINVTANDKVYDSTTAATLTSTGALSGVIGSDNVILITSGTIANFVDANVGNAKTVDVNGYTLSGSAANNYQLLSPQTTTTASITPAGLTITANSNSKTYGDTVTFGGTEFSTSGLLGSDAVTNVSLSSAGAINTANVGNYAIVGSNAQGSGLSNYTITYTDGNLAVSPKALTITASDLTKNYGTTYIFTGTEFTSSGLVNGDVITSVAFASGGAAGTATVNGSPYVITASNAAGANVSNYAISYVNGSFTVLPKDITLTPNDTSKTYGGTTTFTGNEFTAPGLVNGDTISSINLSSGGAAPTASVGNYDIIADPSSIVGSGLSNYNINYATGTLTVNAKSLIISANDSSKVYGQTSPSTFNGYTVSGLVNSDNVSSVDLASLGGAANANVGSYAITASNAAGSGLSNYTIQFNNGTLNVTPLGLTITANSDSKTYGQTYTFNANAFTSSGLVNGDSISAITFSSAGAAAAAQVSGSPYAIIASNATGTGLSNYTINYVNGSLTVNPKDLTITSSNVPKNYGVTYTFSGTEFTSNGLVNGDTINTVNLTSSGTPATAAIGPYAILASGASGTGLSNYNISYQSNGVLTVNPVTLTITANDASKVYGSTHTFNGIEYSVSGLVNSDAVSLVSLSSAGAAATAQVSGSPYAIIANNATGTGLSNYIINYVNGSLTVTPKSLSVTANDLSKTYGSAYTFSNTEFTPNGLVNGDTISSVTLSSAGAAATAQVGGSPYAIIASNAVGTGLSNYTINYVNGNFTVNPKAITVSSNNASKTYGNTYTFSGTEFTTSGLVNGDTINTVNLTSSGAPAAAAIGPYAIIASGASGTGLSNYTITYQNSGVLTVNPATLTITANSGSKVYGDIYNFGAIGYSSSGLVNGDSISSVNLSSAGALATAQVNGSPYAIIASGASGAGLSNYIINYVNGSLTVTPKSLSVTANDLSKTYGSAYTFSNTEYTSNGLVNGDSISTVTLNSAGAAATAQVNGSPYAIIASNAVGTGLSNYTINYVNGSFTVNPKGITVSSNNASKTYGNTYNFNGTEFTVSSGGLVNGDTINTVNLSSLGTPAATSVGNYGINVNGASGTGLSNYTITYQSTGVLTVNPALLTITANGLTKTYDTTTYSGGNGVTYSGFVAGDNPSVLGGTLNYTGDSQGARNVGVYLIIPQGLTATNYLINYVQNNLVINPATIYVSGITASNRVYNATTAATLNTSQLNYSGVLGSDVVNVDASNVAGNFANKMVGNNKLVTITGMLLTGSDSINYVLNLAPVTANITPAVLVSSGVAANNKVYDGNNTATLNFNNASLTGIFAGDSVQLSSAYSANFISSSVGNNIPVNASLALSGADGGNYIIIEPTNLKADIFAASSEPLPPPLVIDDQAVVRTQLLTNQLNTWNDNLDKNSNTDNINLLNVMNLCGDIRHNSSGFCARKKLIWRSEIKNDAVITPNLLAPITSKTTLIPSELTADVVSRRMD